MKPLTRYEHTTDYGPFGSVVSRMVEAADGDYYAKDEADAVIRELEADNVGLRSITLQQADRIAELEAERDAARAVLASGHMQRILRYVFNHAGKGLNGSLQDSAAWIEKQIEATRKA